MKRRSSRLRRQVAVEAPTFDAPVSAQKISLRRSLGLLGLVIAGFGVIGAQLVRLGLQGKPEVRASVAEPVGRNFSRPDLTDRKGRLLATDIEVHSLYADPALILDADEASEKLSAMFPDLDAVDVRRLLSDPARRFVWLKRGLSPARARHVHELGLPGLAFRKELRRVYPMGASAGHVLGAVNIDNKGVSGLERAIDDAGDAEPVLGTARTAKSAWASSIDIGAQHGVEQELAAALSRYGARAAAALVMDASSGEIVAAASVPGVDPTRPSDAADPARLDRLVLGTYELGSIFKSLTIADALDAGVVTLETMVDVREPLKAGPFTIRDLHPQGRPMTVRDIFLHSSNVGAAMIALKGGAEHQRAFLTRLGLTHGMRLETGPVASPQVPQRWDRTETITISYGHGLAVAPVQFMAAFAGLVNGGQKVTPTFRMREAKPYEPITTLISATTSARMRELMRLNVTHASGTGRRAEAEGYRVGGKTGTAEMAGVGGYTKKSVISSFAAAFPMDAPRYVMLVMLFEPQGQDETKGQITAGVNAAPVAGRIVARIAPGLGVLPRRVSDSSVSPSSGSVTPPVVFDGTRDAQ
jgi:cell division protein FtsI (penicillin-binding protein 3)